MNLRVGGVRVLEDVSVLCLYRNIKTGGIYQVTKLAKHSETLEPMVIYEWPHSSGEVWARPLDLFKEKFEGPVSESDIPVDIPF